MRPSREVFAFIQVGRSYIRESGSIVTKIDMMNQDIQGLLASSNYQNERGSILSFKDGRVTKNDEFIGTYLVQREGDEDLLLITSEDLGTVAFYVLAETGDGKRTRIRLCRNKGDEACVLLTEVGGASPL